MKLLLPFVFASLFAGSLHSQCTGIHFEVHEELNGSYNEYDLTGYTVYRVYADFATDSNIIHSMTTPGDLIDEEYLGPIEIISSGSIFHHPQGGILGSQVNEVLAETVGFESVALDSYFTINLEFNTDPGQLIYIDETPDQGEFDDNGFTMTLGTFSSVNGSANTFVENQKALIAQVTTNGVPRMCTYVQYAIDSNLNYLQGYFCANGEQGCHLPEAANYNPEAGIVNNDLCLNWVCADETACNYSLEGIVPEESICIYPECGQLGACNYSAEAACYDNSLCEFAATFPIAGTVSVVTGPQTFEFSYPETLGSIYSWEVSGGSIISGQGSNSIVVVFDEVGTQVVTVQETLEDGCTANNSIFQVQVSSSVGVDELQTDTFVVYPNPCSELLMMNLAQPSGNLMIYDGQGKLIFSKRLHDTIEQLDLSEFQPGIYLFHFTSGMRSSYERVVVRR